eukprot:14406910-Heterocapsa_arctica.AAC.1
MSRSQTRLGEEKYKEEKANSNDIPITKEENKTQNDTKAGNKANNTKKQGRLFKQEKEEGTIIMTINLSGSQFDFDFILEHCQDHILLIQEHWKLNHEIHTWESKARMKGWQG